MKSAIGRNKAVLVFAAIALLLFSLPLVAKRWLSGQLIDLTKVSGGEIPYGQSAITALVNGPDGKVYGGTSADRPGKEAYLFRYKEGNDVEVLGKPIREQRIRALTVGPDGMLYGIGGEDDFVSKLFRYNPKTGDMRELGVIHERGWTVYRIDTLIATPDGSLYLGESARISHLIRIADIRYISVIGA